MQILAPSIFVRTMGISFLLAFLSQSYQVIGLFGKNGITPITNSIFLNTDFALMVSCYSGIVLSILLVLLPFIINKKFLNYTEAAICFILFFIYREYLIHGNVFMNFQWDILIIESSIWTALYCLFKKSESASQVFTWVFRFMIFKLMFMSGLVKLNSQDPSWADLSALSYHYYTQPIPNPISFFVHQLPATFHTLSCIIMFMIELITPFFIFINARFRMIAAVLFISLQLVIIFTGNYCFFNLLTIFLCLWLIDDKYLASYIPNTINEKLALRKLSRPESIISQIINDRLEKLNLGNFRFSKIIVNILALYYISVSSLFIIASIPFNFPLKYLSGQLGQQALLQTKLWLPASPYGLFAVMTTKRYEIVIQGLADERSSWKDYEFYFKPGDTRRMPAQVAPYQPRLDWQMWFAALSNYQNNPWIVNLTARLLENQKDVLGLLQYNPFPDSPPKYIRAIVYEYKFNTVEGFLNTGETWLREPIGEYLPAVSLKQSS